MEKNEKGSVCVTGGTGYVASWLIMRLLQSGYSVNTTVNHLDSEGGSFLERLPNASNKLKIYSTNTEKPESFYPAIEGCNYVIIAHSIDFEDNGDGETQFQRALNGILCILKNCLDSTTLKRVIYTSSDSAVVYNEKGPDVVDESSWSDVDFIKKLNPLGAFYSISKTLIEKQVLSFADRLGLNVVTVNHSWVLGPFITPQCPQVVRVSLAMILGNWNCIDYDCIIPLVHIDDVAQAHIFLMESPQVKGRYICSNAEITPQELSQFLRLRYPHYQIPTFDCLKVTKEFKYPRASSKKLLESGFKFKYNLEDMYDEAIMGCKQLGLL